MSKIKVTLTGVLVVAVVALAFIGFTSNSTAKLTDTDIARARVRAQVFELCNYSRLSINDNTEELCGSLQDKTNTEYICEQKNQSPVNHCWVEDK